MNKHVGGYADIGGKTQKIRKKTKGLFEKATGQPKKKKRGKMSPGFDMGDSNFPKSRRKSSHVERRKQQGESSTTARRSSRGGGTQEVRPQGVIKLKRHFRGGGEGLRALHQRSTTPFGEPE